MRYDKVKTLEEICTTFPGRWSGETAKALIEDIISTVGDSTVVEVPVDVGAYLCSTMGTLDFSLVNDVVNSKIHNLVNNSGLYIGKIENTDIHVFTIDEYDLILPSREIEGNIIPPMAISIVMCPVKAEERTLKTEWAFDENTISNQRKYYGHKDEIGKKFQADMDMIREIADK